MSRQTSFPWRAWLPSILSLAATMVLLASCEPAPLAGKACPCADGYACCPTSGLCVANADINHGDKCPCSSVQPASSVITAQGYPQPSDGNLLFTDPSGQQWVSFTYAGLKQDPPTAAVTPDGNGVDITARFVAGDSANVYGGFGLIFLNEKCLDASSFRGVQFDFSGDLGGGNLFVGATPAENVMTLNDPIRGMCTTKDPANCYGPSVSVAVNVNPVQVLFSSMLGGKPDSPLDTARIVNVKWQVDSEAHFSLQNVQFFY